MSKEKTVVEAVATACAALRNCEQRGADVHALDVAARWQRYLADIERECLPRGSGFDAGTRIDSARSRGNRIVLNTSYHHMSPHGFYSGWTEHNVIVVPSFLGGFDLRITGRNTDGWKDYAADVFYAALSAPLPTYITY